MEKEYNFPVFHTQGGGLVREVNGVYIFVESPGGNFGLDVGDIMPEQWGLVPGNDLAEDEFDEQLEGEPFDW